MTRIRFVGCDLSPSGHPRAAMLPSRRWAPRSAQAPVETMATAPRSDVQVAQRFLDALAAADWAGIESLLAPDVQMRALLPSALREWQGRKAVVERFKFWWAPLEDLQLLDSGLEPAGDQVRVRYRLAGDDPDD